MATDTELETAMRSLAADLGRIAAAMPELTGLSLAYDRGNVDSSEWESAQADAARLSAEESGVGARIEELRARAPEEMIRHVASFAARLSEVAPRLGPGEQAVVPDLIASLTAWAAQQPSRYPMTWAWRVAYQLAAR
jgi:hypothetical protein